MFHGGHSAVVVQKNDKYKAVTQLLLGMTIEEALLLIFLQKPMSKRECLDRSSQTRRLEALLVFSR